MLSRLEAHPKPVPSIPHTKARFRAFTVVTCLRRARRATFAPSRGGASQPIYLTPVFSRQTGLFTPYAKNPSLPPLFFAVRIKPWRILPSAPISLQKSVMTW